LCGNVNTSWRNLGALTLLAIGVFSQTAQANPVSLPPSDFGSAVIGGIDTTACPSSSANCMLFSSTTSGVSGSLSDPSTGSSAGATANQSLGYVGASVSGVGGPTPGSSYARALVWDTLTFSGAAPGATVTITMSGNAALSGDARIAATAILLPASGALSEPPADYLLEGNLYELFQGVGAAPFNAGPSYSFQETFGITNGVPMFLGIDVQAYAGVSVCDVTCPVPGSASIDDPFSLTLPDGVTYTSDYEDSLTAVPEPATWMAFLMGIGGTLFKLNRRRGRDAVARA
jgi:hypothetical protein